MMNILSLLPKSLWVCLGVGVITVMVIFTSYNTGVDNTNTKWLLKIEEQVNDRINSKLIDVNKQLELALSFKETKDKIIEDQTNRINASTTAYNALQERLNDVLSNPTNDCTSLPDDEYRLYKDYLSQGR